MYQLILVVEEYQETSNDFLNGATISVVSCVRGIPSSATVDDFLIVHFREVQTLNFKFKVVC